MSRFRVFALGCLLILVTSIACGFLLFLRVQWFLPISSTLLSAPRRIVTNDLELEVKWQYPIRDLLIAPLAHNENMVFVPQGDVLHILNAKTGLETGTFSTATNPLQSHSTIAQFFPEMKANGDTVALLTNNGYDELVVVDTFSGRTLWRKSVTVLYSIAMDDDRIYLGEMGHVGAYTKNTGESMWTFSDGLPSSHRSINVHFGSNKIYVIAESRVVVLESDSGRVVTSFDYQETRADIVFGDKIFGLGSQSIFAIDNTTGGSVWIRKLPPPARYIRPTLIDDVLYVITEGGNLYAIDTISGREKWVSRNLAPFSNVAVFRANGYVITEDGSLSAFNLQSGERIRSLSTEPRRLAGYINWQPAIPSLFATNDMLVVTFGDSLVFGLSIAPP